jgi:hypothetical protein
MRSEETIFRKKDAMRKTKFSIIFVPILISLVFIAYAGKFAKIELRNIPKKLSGRDIKAAVEKLNFFDKELNESGDYPNDFVDNGNGTVTDKASGLMWEQKGSEKVKSWYCAEKYLKELNNKMFAGFCDWRIPTIEELYSLLQPKSNQQLYIDPVFDTDFTHFWSIDAITMEAGVLEQFQRRFTLDFKKGTVSYAFVGRIQGGASAKNFSSSVRAVRCIK